MRYDMAPRVRAYILANPTHGPAQLAAALGIARQTARNCRSALISEGLLRPLRGRAVALDEVRDKLEGGRAVRRIAQDVGVRADTVYRRLYGAGLSVQAVRREHVFSATAIARLFCYSRSAGQQHILAWRAAGLLKARKSSRKRSAPWLISADALMAFLDNPAAWHLFTPSQITDPDWREYAEDARRRAPLRGRSAIPREPRHADRL